MEYFILRQDRRYLNTPNILDFTSKFGLREHINIKNANKIKNFNVAFCESEIQPDFIDVLDMQLFLVSKELKDVLEIYDHLIFKMVCILHNQTNSYREYYAPLLPAISCLAKRPDSFVGRTQADKLLLDKDKIEGHSIFKMDGLEDEFVVIDLELAESILRRDFSGIELQRMR